MDNRLENEINHGKFLAANGAGEIWNWESPAGKLRWARRVRMLTSRVLPGMKLLEIGCGTGYFSKELVKTGAQITSIDISTDLIDLAKQNVTGKNIKFAVENAYALNYSDDSFDMVVGSSVLHHLDVDKALSQFYRVLKKGGVIVFTEPNMLNPQIAVQKNIPMIKKLMGDSPDETAFFKFSLKKKLRNFNFSEISIVPFDFLHPSIPERIIPLVKPCLDFFEKIPLLSSIAGSLYIIAKK